MKRLVLALLVSILSMTFSFILFNSPSESRENPETLSSKFTWTTWTCPDSLNCITNETYSRGTTFYAYVYIYSEEKNKAENDLREKEYPFTASIKTFDGIEYSATYPNYESTWIGSNQFFSINDTTRICFMYRAYR